MMQEYVAKNPWPTKDEMEERFKASPQAMQLWAEYGETNHEALKEIYESAIDKDVARKWGEILAERGGVRALQYNCMAFIYYGQLSLSPNQILRANARLLEFAWSGIKDRMGDEFAA